MYLPYSDQDNEDRYLFRLKPDDRAATENLSGFLKELLRSPKTPLHDTATLAALIFAIERLPAPTPGIYIQLDFVDCCERADQQWNLMLNCDELQIGTEGVAHLPYGLASDPLTVFACDSEKNTGEGYGLHDTVERLIEFASLHDNKMHISDLNGPFTAWHLEEEVDAWDIVRHRDKHGWPKYI